MLLKTLKSNIPTTEVTLKSVKCSKGTQCGKQAIYNVLKIIFDFKFYFWIFIVGIFLFVSELKTNKNIASGQMRWLYAYPNLNGQINV